MNILPYDLLKGSPIAFNLILSNALCCDEKQIVPVGIGLVRSRVQGEALSFRCTLCSDCFTTSLASIVAIFRFRGFLEIGA